MTIAYDTGALIAAESGDRRLWAEHRVRLEAGYLPITTAPVVAQASRSPRQVQLRRFLRGCDIRPMTVGDSHPVGALLAAAGTSDVVDAHLVLVASATTILTSDPRDIRRLAELAQPSPVVRVV